MSEKITIIPLDQAVSDPVEVKLDEVIQALLPIIESESPEVMKHLLHPSDTENAAAFTVKNFGSTFPNAFGTDFPWGNFNNAMDATPRVGRILHKVEIIYNMINAKRQFVGHVKKQTVLLSRAQINQGYELGHHEYKTAKDELDAIYAKTTHLPTAFSIPINDSITISDVDSNYAFYNSGIVALSILIGIDESSEWIEIPPKELYKLSACTVIKVKNLSATTIGECKVRIKV